MAATFLNRARDLLGLQTPGSKAAEPAAPPQKKPPTTWHAVSIAPGSRCCAAAKELEGRRFLSRQAPVLPLKACTRADCTCRYQHYDDRRKGPRRAREMGVAVDGWVEEERRTPVRGRRTNDRKEK